MSAEKKTRTWRLGEKPTEYVDVFYDAVRQCLVVRGGEVLAIEPSASNVIHVRLRP